MTIVQMNQGSRVQLPLEAVNEIVTKNREEDILEFFKIDFRVLELVNQLELTPFNSGFSTSLPKP